MLEEVSESKYLVVIIREELKWGQHINTTSDKSNKTLGFLGRNLKYAPQSLKEQAYMSYVRTTIEHSATIWDPYYQKHIDKLHKV